QGLAGLAVDPGFAQTFYDRIGVIRLELELGADQHGIIQIAPVIREAELVPLTDLHVTAVVEHFHRAYALADFTGAIARIATQRAADRSGDAHQRLESGQAMTGRFGNERRQRCPRAGPDPIAVHAPLGKRRLAQAEAGAPNALNA